MKKHPPSVKVELVDSQRAVGELLTGYMTDYDGCEVVGCAQSGEEGLREIQSMEPDLLIVDVILPDLPVIAFLDKLREAHYHGQIIAFTRSINPETARNLARAGVRGIVTKEDSLHTLLEAVRTVMGGGCYYPPGVARVLGNGHGARLLTAREKVALRLIAEGLPTKLVGDRMQISVKTAEKYRERIMAKLKVHDAVNLTRYALKNGLAVL